MALKKDKQKVLDEVLDDNRIRSFLDIPPPDGIDADFNVLEKAYRGLPEGYFDTFLGFFVAAGRNINAKNPAGKTMLEIVSTHRLGGEYADLLKQHGAK